MRRGQYNSEWIEDSAGLMGIALGSDYCTEHETGIAGIRDAFGVTRTAMEYRVFGIVKKVKPLFGVEVRKIRKNAASYFIQGDIHIIGYTRGNPDFLKSLVRPDINWGDKDFVAFWHEDAFAILSTNENKMQTLWNAFENLDVAVFTGSMQAFSNGSGLNIHIVSRMPAVLKNDMERSDRSAYELRKKADATGIEKKLRAAGKEFYALSPRWDSEKEGNVLFWLNPMDQRNNNYGLYSVEELEQWIKNEGPIPIKKEEAVTK